MLEEAAGTITVTPAALASIVTQAAETVGDAKVRRGRRRLEVEVSAGGAHVRLELSARYGAVLPDLAREVQERVADAVVAMCAVRVDAVDVSVEEVE
jgi:uncharacterized alkaline shock family protein YloU